MMKLGISLKTWLKIAIVPAALYNVQNIAALLAYQNLEPLTFNVLNQTKTLSAALCCYFVIGKKQSSMQMCSLILLLVAALIIEKIVSLSTFTPPFFSGTTGLLGGLFAADGSMKLARHVTHGVFPILIASFISGLAGAIVQKVSIFTKVFVRNSLRRAFTVLHFNFSPFKFLTESSGHV